MKSNSRAGCMAFAILLFAMGFVSSVADREEQGMRQTKNQTKTERVLSRKRRFLAFPYGSSFSASICTTIGMYGNPNYNWISYALNFGVSYNLPNETWVIDSTHGFANTKVDDASSDSESLSAGEEILQKRRTRRDAYRQLELVIDKIGFDGRQCVQKALCEAAKLFFGKKGTMVEQMVKTIFSYPGGRSYTTSELLEEHHYTDYMYQDAFAKGKSTASIDYCSYYFANCTFSIIDLAFGKYSVRPTTLMKNNFNSFM